MPPITKKGSRQWLRAGRSAETHGFSKRSWGVVGKFAELPRPLARMRCEPLTLSHYIYSRKVPTRIRKTP